MEKIEKAALKKKGPVAVSNRSPWHLRQLKNAQYGGADPARWTVFG
jgi:hypothetical protein